MSVARWLETDSLSNQNIAAAAVIGAYTADADRMVVVDVSLDQVAGNGDYVIYVTRQINGAGSAYVMLPKTTCAAASGETAIAMQSGMISVRSGDVLTVYLDGLAGDTTTPDTIVRWFELAALRPATADRTLAVDESGNIALADDGITAAKLAADAATEIADALLKRDMSAVTGESARSPLNALRALRNKVAVVDTTMTVYKEDDSTPAWTADVVGTTGADPVTSVDPT